jgi:hypothetical protein
LANEVRWIGGTEAWSEAHEHYKMLCAPLSEEEKVEFWFMFDSTERNAMVPDRRKGRK